MSKHKLDLHDIFNKGDQIDRALREAMEFCIDRRIDPLEIIPGKGSGQLKMFHPAPAGRRRCASCSYRR